MLAGTLSSICRMIQAFRYKISSQEDIQWLTDSQFSAKVTYLTDAMKDEDFKTQWCVPSGPLFIRMCHEKRQWPEGQRPVVVILKTPFKCCILSEGRILKLFPGLFPVIMNLVAGFNISETCQGTAPLNLFPPSIWSPECLTMKIIKIPSLPVILYLFVSLSHPVPIEKPKTQYPNTERIRWHMQSQRLANLFSGDKNGFTAGTANAYRRRWTWLFPFHWKDFEVIAHSFQVS